MASISLRLWSDGDLPLLHLANTSEMTEHLNGPETEQQLTERHKRYLRLCSTGEARMFVILDEERPVGSIGYWRIDWRGQPAFETGWFVLPEAQGRGVASDALAAVIPDAREHRDERRMLTAFPGVDNPASNGVCRRNGFTLTGTFTEIFREKELTMNEWVLDLRTPARPAA
ncbi:GNAT family N-acetyltransferase [Microbacterium sp. NPDC089318]